MLIAGFQKLTLIDYPGKIAATVFTAGCNFRCPFCHNPELVKYGNWNAKLNNIEKEFWEHLKKRQGKLEGVCLTGGEPTIQPDIFKFVKKIKKAGYAVKLDTNGARPDILKKMLDEKMVDYVAMDIKNQPGKYDQTAGTKCDIGRIKLSVDLIKNSRVPYEFRTTVVPGLHSLKDFLIIAEWLKGSRAYWLQAYRAGKILDPAFGKKIKNKRLNLEKIKTSIEKNFDFVGVRG